MSEERFKSIEARLDRFEGIFRSIADSFDPPPTKQTPPQEQPTQPAKSVVVGAGVKEFKSTNVAPPPIPEPKSVKESPAEQPSFTEADLEAIQWLPGANGEWVFRQNTRGETSPLIIKMRDLLDSELARGAKGPVKVGKWLIGYNDPNHVFIGRRVA